MDMKASSMLSVSSNIKTCLLLFTSKKAQNVVGMMMMIYGLVFRYLGHD